MADCMVHLFAGRLPEPLLQLLADGATRHRRDQAGAGGERLRKGDADCPVARWAVHGRRHYRALHLILRKRAGIKGRGKAFLYEIRGNRRGGQKVPEADQEGRDQGKLQEDMVQCEKERPECDRHVRDNPVHDAYLLGIPRTRGNSLVRPLPPDHHGGRRRCHDLFQHGETEDDGAEDWRRGDEGGLHKVCFALHHDLLAYVPCRDDSAAYDRPSGARTIEIGYGDTGIDDIVHGVLSVPGE